MTSGEASTDQRLTPQQFIAKWQRAGGLSERSACQQHFLDLCDVLSQPQPAEADPDGAWYTFERGVQKTGGGKGWADVWKRDHFGWEYKGKHKDLVAAYHQLLQYREDLDNPPLLVVCDLDRFQIHTNFTGTAKRVHAFDLSGLAKPENLAILRDVFSNPKALRPGQTAVGVTEAVSGVFGQLADALRARGVAAPDAAHFLMKLMFCCFAEDVGLLPKDLFTTLVTKSRKDPSRLTRLLRELFTVMMTGGDFGADTIAHFNGGLFADADVIDLMPDEIEKLVLVARHDWGSVEPSIFGTLFERTLDPAKRAQVGAQYTSGEDILTLVEPVLMAPLRREWAEVKGRCDKLWVRVKETDKKLGPKLRRRAETPARRKHDKPIHDFIERLSHVRVLDPACGSGNFLYVSIRLLLDLEKEVIKYAADRGLGLTPHVRPTQLHGIEILPYAHQLAQVVIWIGYLQWMRDNGFRTPKDPILEPIDSIVRMDAVLDLSDPDNPREPDWPEADVIVGNPPFLGDKLLRTNLGDDYVDSLFEYYAQRLPHGSDLCCYWFEKARAMVEEGLVKRVGLLGTQGIRGGANRTVLQRIKGTGDIFFGVADRDWILDGANVHVAMVGFDNGIEQSRLLDGRTVDQINANLASGVDTTSAIEIPANQRISFLGNCKGGAFDIPETLAKTLVAALGNPNRRSNADVLRPYVNGQDVAGRSRRKWLIDFGVNRTLKDAAEYHEPMKYVRTHVHPSRSRNRNEWLRKHWWLHQRARPAMRASIAKLARYLVTPTLAKFRLFVWISHPTLPDHQLIVFARDDDYFFGVLHSAVHERWSLRMGTALEDRPRYTPTTCFETFAFPPLAGGIAMDVPQSRDFPAAPDKYDADQANALRARIADAAKKLNDLRESWLNPTSRDGSPMLNETQLKKRTLTNLYNERPTWLELAHLELDRAVLAAYGWPETWAESLQPQRDARGRVNPILGVADPAVEQQLLAGLLSLNQAQP